MRHVYADRATVTLTAVLVLSVVLFAWLRSEAITLVAFANGDLDGPDVAGIPGEQAGWRALGQDVYAADCRACHARLTHVPRLLEPEEGRAWLIDFMLHGHEGEAVIEGRRRTLDHPAFDALSDEEVAAVLNHMLVSWGNAERLPEGAELYREAEVATARTRPLSPGEVAGRRPLP